MMVAAEVSRKLKILLKIRSEAIEKTVSVGAFKKLKTANNAIADFVHANAEAILKALDE